MNENSLNKLSRSYTTCFVMCIITKYYRTDTVVKFLEVGLKSFLTMGRNCVDEVQSLGKASNQLPC